MNSLNKIYLKKIDDIAKFSIWKVDGEYIRKNIDPDFVGYDHHKRFSFIPVNEFWIDSSVPKDELHYCIDHMLKEYHLMEKGFSYDEAYKKAIIYQERERAKSRAVKKLKRLKDKKKEIFRIKRRLLDKYTNGIEVWLVKGKLVRSLFFAEFSEGGHDKVYPFIPDNEIWIEETLSPTERKFILLHELRERYYMKKFKMDYKQAHKKATKLEEYCRKYKSKLEKEIITQLKKNE
jgi:hypothetical protein